MNQDIEADGLILRYGSSNYFEDVFNGLEYYDIKGFYGLLENKSKTSHSDKYEMARQTFLKLLGQERMIWHPTLGKDKNVELCRLYREDRNEYLAIMRIRPRGYREERRVPPGTEITFHLLMGKVAFKREKRLRVMARGNHTTVGPCGLYGVKSLSDDQTCYLVIKINRPN